MKIKITGIQFVLLSIISFALFAQQTSNAVKVVGQMKNVMWLGQLHGNIYLDTIADKTNLYGFGPVEYLTGEILITDGRSYRSTVTSGTEMKVDETYDIRAPFFAYANISKWKEQALPDSVRTLQQLEIYLAMISKASAKPFFFKLTGTVEHASIHIVNLPKGSKVSSPDEAHRGKINYELNSVVSDMIGFFSTDHKTIFTRHDTFLHVHLITSDRQKMGHLDEVQFKTGTIKLYLPS